MSTGVFKSVHAVSSEDALHLIVNLLKENAGKKWKTAHVFLEFEEPQQIPAIDIGNEHATESIKQEPGQDELDELDALIIDLLHEEMHSILNKTTTTAAAATAAGATTTQQVVPSNNQLITQSAAMASIKLEPDSMSSMSTSTNVSFVKKPAHSIYVAGKESVTSSSIASHQPPGGAHSAPHASHAPPPPTLAPSQHHKPDVKKRADKRRATHNEGERRRREEINSWLFKLKEMLPTDQNNGRTPRSDSKSQILIKACDYIKSMQNEIDNLRNWLREAESLRVSNQQLRDELHHVNRQQQQELQELRFNTAGGSFNSLNSSATSDLFDDIDAVMIADYDE